MFLRASLLEYTLMKLLVLSASTGGGHDMRAFALSDWWMEKGGKESEVYHPLENTFLGYRAGCELYNIIQKKLPLLHFAYFHFLEFAAMHRKASHIIGGQKFVRKIQAYSPDLIVSTHAHLNHGYYELSRLPSSKASQFVVYCGELADGQGFSRHWINPKNDLFISPFEEGIRAAQKRGMPTEKTLIGGPLLRKPFYQENQKFDRIKVIKALGFDSQIPIFLLATGANGVNRHISVLKELSNSMIHCQVLALCGTNEKTYQGIINLSLNDCVKVVPYRRITADSMVEFLRASTWMLARPGAGLTTEAIATGCPVIFDLSGGCMPQEKNNLNFWRSRTGTLLTAHSPAQLIKIIRAGNLVPRLNIPLEESPSLLLTHLFRLARNSHGQRD